MNRTDRIAWLCVGGLVLFVSGCVFGSVLELHGSKSVPVKAVIASTPETPSPAPASPPSDSTAEAERAQGNHGGGGLDYLTYKAAAEEKLKAVLTDDHDVRYRNVETRLSTLDGGGIVAFCGEVDSRTPLGGYGGFKRFIASQSVATTEDGMTEGDFQQAWDKFCTEGILAPKVWF